MPVAYYARPMSLYGTPQEKRDRRVIRSLGYTIVPFTRRMEKRAQDGEGMEPFLEQVRKSDILFFRAFPCGRIGAGVDKEIAEARSCKIIVLELPTYTPGRSLTKDETIRYLRLHGQR